MGYTTDFIGHIDIDPVLNEDEIAYLTAFSHSRRYDRDGGPYDVPANPAAEYCRAPDVPTDQYNAIAPGQPQLWCQWVPCWDGCCLAFDGNEKFYQPVPWMTYLIEHFLKPGAEASKSGDDRFSGFTFDHQLNGLIIGCRRDNKELFAIDVSNNLVTKRILRPADPMYGDWPPLPYEDAIDRDQESRRRRRRGRSAGNLVEVRTEG